MDLERQMSESRQAFQKFEKRKFDGWKQVREQMENPENTQHTDNRQEDQKAFDDYVKSVGASTKFGDYSKPFNDTHQHMLDRWVGQARQPFAREVLGNVPSPQVGDYVAIRIKATDNLYLTMFAKIVDLTRSLVYLIVYNIASGKVASGGGAGTQGPTGPQGPAGHTPKITATANALTENAGVPASVSILSNDTDDQGGKRFDFTFHIPKGDKGERGEQGPAGPAGSGGGGGSSSDVPNVPKNKDYATIEGEFGTNLLDYRELSRDNHIKVNGKVFYLDNTRKLLESNDKIKTLSLYNRLRAGDASASHNITFKSKLIESSDRFYDGAVGNNKLQIKLYKRQLSGDPVHFKDVIFTNDTSSIPSGHPNDTTKLDYKDNYSYISVDMGGDSVPAKGKIYLSAYYGEIEPKGLSQKFEFKNYNGFELKKNAKGTADEYIHTTWYDKLKIRLGLLNLKDAELVKVSEGEDNNTIIVKVPKDLWINPNYFKDKQEGPTIEKIKKEFNDNLMTSNLCDIYQSDDHVDIQTKPFFIKAVTEEIDKTGHPVKCFNILIGKQYMSRWREHLSETQILYPVQDPESDKFVQLPVGGLIFTLNSGQSIETNKFSKIENYKLEQLKTRGLIFKDSPFGYQDVVIDADNITSVVTNTVPQQFVPISNIL